jgi:hypothetical protein
MPRIYYWIDFSARVNKDRVEIFGVLLSRPSVMKSYERKSSPRMWVELPRGAGLVFFSPSGRDCLGNN